METIQSIPNCLKFPTTMETPAGEMYRQWAVLDHSSYPYHMGSAATQVHFWADFPPVLNERMNREVEQLSAQLSAGQVYAELTINYNWSSYQYSRDTRSMQPCMVECVVDLMKMTQRNVQSGKERAVKFYYKPSTPS